MKRILLTGFILTAFVNLYGQKKRDNTIVIDTSISLQSLKMILFNKGYMVSNSDSVFILTQEKTVTGAVAMRLQIAITDTGIVLKAQQKILVELQLWGTPIKNDYEPVFAWYVKSSPYYDTWKELDGISKNIGNKRKYYKQ